MIGGLLPLLVLGAIVYAIVNAVKRRESGQTGVAADGMDVGRAFRYLLLFGSLVVAAIGVTEILGLVIASSDARSDAEVAGSLAMTIVALPVFIGLARWVWRTHRDDPAERDSVAWALYLNTTLIVTLAVAVGTAFAVSDRIVNAEWRGTVVAAFVVWTAAWAAHWWAWRTKRPSIGGNVQLWFGSAIGLWVAAFSAGTTLDLLVRRTFDSASDVLVAGDAKGLALAAIGTAIGAAVWIWHWLRHGLHAIRSGGWYVYVLLLGVFAGLAAAVGGAGYGLYLVLEWFWGDPASNTAVAQFRNVAAPLAAVVVGLAVWSYHRSVVGPATEEPRTEVHRAYDYLVSAVALGTVAIAITILVVAFFTVITPASAAASDDTGINTLLAAVTLLAVGAPMWALTWRRIQQTCAGDEEEIGAPSRRRYLFAIFGISGAIAFGALIGALVVVFEAVLGERSGGAIAADLDLPVALLVTAGAIAAYHWTVYRAERHVVVRQPTRDVLLVCDGVVAIDEIASRTHTRIRVLHRHDLAPETPEDTEANVAAIDSTAGDHLLVVAGPGAVEVVPYE